MHKKEKNTLESIGYITEIPENANINDYEAIQVRNKSGTKKNLYRLIKKTQVTDKITDFNNSWKVFTDYLS
tara:strand:+ start:514 stop:726 length:213 start_codon:yes stop_codon:yes gene_type:complete